MADFDEYYDLDAVMRRLIARPDSAAAPPELAYFEVEVEDDDEPDQYARRVRLILVATVEVARSADFSGEKLPLDGFPEWFYDSGEQESESSDSKRSRRGKARYVAEYGERPWDPQDWLYRFDPESEFRNWVWWDVTRVADRRLRVWVDTAGEDLFSSMDLRWLLFACGALGVSEPAVASAADWASEPSVGLEI